ncbi:MAG: dipicolinate synthase subunit DpsA [Eubacteriales bacterium]
MQPALEGMKVAVLGGDARELALMRELAVEGAKVVGLRLPPGVEPGGLVECRDSAGCVAGADAVILPVPGINERGRLPCAYSEEPIFLTGEILALIPKKAPVFVGMARPILRKMVEDQGLTLIELMQMDEVAILNSIPSAEGAVQMAMEMMSITIHGCVVFVLGFGRTGMTLARLMRSLGADTRVVARKPAHLARIYEMGLLPLTFNDLPGQLKDADLVVNTAPALVLTAEVLKEVPAGAIIIDLASSPGGTDFEAAAALGIKAVLAPGLPGKVAPRTAGRILARVITRLLRGEKGLI